MWNILGDIWPDDNEPDWDSVTAFKSAKLHLYGKKAARAGRKMGHINCLGGDNQAAKDLLLEIKQTLKP